MNTNDEAILEQLSAYMDGELPEAEARFLLRRLENDTGLRQKWESWQVAAACLKGQPVRVMRPSLDQQLATSLAGPQSAVPERSKRPWMAWGIAASLGMLAVLFAPGLLRQDAAAPVVASAASTGPDHMVPSPSSADLVALTATPAATTAALAFRATQEAAPPVGQLIASNAGKPVRESPVPLSEQSPADFPLLQPADKRGWPRSELAGNTSDPSLEAYLVRHNQMLANDGIGGFVPYLDVVATDQATAPANPDGTEADARGEEAPASGAGGDEK